MMSDHEKVSFYQKTKKLLIDLRQTFRESGLKGLYKKYGWKLFLAFFLYYLIRDVTLYILLPLWLAGKFSQFWN